MTEKLIARSIEARERYRIFKGETFWFVIVAKNGEVICTSEVYSSDQKRDQTGKQMASQLDVPYVDNEQ